MPTIKHFSISNFRGAKSVQIELDGRTRRQVITLIGLNESGKTTILEAISNFPTNDSVVSAIFRKDNEAKYALTFLPIHRRANFTGKVVIEGDIALSDDDMAAITLRARALGYELDPQRKISTIKVKKAFEFKNGDFVPSEFGSIWDNLTLHVRRNRRGSFKVYERPGKDSSEVDLWVSIANVIEARLPNIVYFPNFIVEVPERIYLSSFDKESDTNKYYRKILENVVASLGEDLSIDTHVVRRIAAFRARTGIDNWIAKLLGDTEKSKIDPVFSKLSLAITREVLGNWGKVFNRPVAAKAIKVDWFVDPANNLPYAEVTVSDGESTYHLHERSLGFRWFFSFLLFTRFGGTRGRPNLFLFDEPAANLHARAQAQLLGSFDRLISGGDLVIYSTHSHHMIKPEWLQGAYIVENEAIDYDLDSAGFEYDVRNTNIKATPYRTFVGINGDRVSYFQPVLERLQYVEPAVVASGPQVLVEGPSDFYAMSYVKLKASLSGLAVVPGGGAGSLGPMISIALSRGYPFVVLLDDDKAGRTAREKYRSEWGLEDTNVVTLGDVDPTLSGMRLESLLDQDTLDLVSRRFGNAKKQSIGLYLAEIAATGEDNALGKDTIAKLEALLRASLSEC